jgi:hypothetical protein
MTRNRRLLPCAAAADASTASPSSSRETVGPVLQLLQGVHNEVDAKEPEMLRDGLLRLLITGERKRKVTTCARGICGQTF